MSMLDTRVGQQNKWKCQKRELRLFKWTNFSVPSNEKIKFNLRCQIAEIIAKLLDLMFHLTEVKASLKYLMSF